MPDELPLEVSDQLAPIDNLAVSSFITIAIGPRFVPGTSNTDILKAFRQDLLFLFQHSPEALGDAEATKQLVAAIDKCRSQGGAIPCSIGQLQSTGVLSDIARATQFDVQTPTQSR